jgi:hypothetical protein
MPSAIANNWKELLAYGIPNYNTNTFKIILMRAGFTFDKDNHEEYADVLAQELSTALGYTIGGQTLAGISITNDPVLDRTRIKWNNPSWAVTGGNLQAAGAIIFDDSVAAPDIDPIVAYIDFGGIKTTYNGGTFTIANVAINHA